MTAITRDDERVYATCMRRFGALDDAAIREGLALVRVRPLDKGSYLLRSGERAHETAVVVTGLLREHFVLPDGHERTKAFALEGDITGSIADLLSGAPSRAFIVAEEPSRLLVAAFDETEALVAQSPAWAHVRARITEAVLRRKAEREYELLALDAEARYDVFRARYEGLEARVAAKHVASYLGITPVHLSRLRRRRRASVKAPRS